MFGRHHPIVTGVVAGIVWASVFRLWMRFITIRPEFTWSGTLFIVGVGAYIGLVLGVVWWRHLRGGNRRWRLLGLATLPAFGGQALIMLPSVVAGAFGFGRINWPRSARVGLVAVALGAQYALFGTGEFPPGRVAPALAGYSVIIGVEMWAASVLFRPWVTTADRVPAPAST